ncbi:MULTISPECIES: glycosyltransferase [Acinetobacter]|uniref:Putative glycosyl transferase family 1 n=1 Tax=Acinetobacter baylyi (strain ATCC 33305 / BD413 / ADP1) TaxID=62977 RepID=Q6FFT7_ACIAD|nr:MULTISPECIES: glycosyltransferase [Acinetobacter]ENV53058.1 hypothetical protein F952_02887 [Acinetobacter baylyi DSM 14961 = CIP 107474]KAF2372028.1 hypothetical protein BSL67_14480 [Acinetobacter baylyi]KAF2372298.1 hypothetical protein BSL88_03730 [Acinetobacter baylyi]KAF2378319.1 hypothetical protein BSN81_04430 [Acinetobacter baylyi]KAF2380643.1 hypothetical protein BSN83_09150 [Acinetobacter baylyi]
MKVLHVITNFSAVGGAETMLSRLILAQPQFEHHVVALMRVNEIYQTALEQCASVTALQWNGRNSLAVLKQLRDMIRQIQPDVIQGWMYHANVMSKLACIGLKQAPPLYWSIHHSLAAFQDESRSTKLALYLSRVLSPYVTGVVYCAHSAQAQHQAFGFRPKQHCVIANGIVMDDFKIQLNKPQQHKPLLVGFAGRYHVAKGFEYLFGMIASVQHLPIEFWIAGKGADLNNPDIQQLIQQYHIDLDKIKLMGQVEDMPAFYQQLDLFVMTSITEGLPTVLIEAMASGVPCVTTNVGDAGFIVQDTGYVVPARDVEQLSQAVQTFYALPEAQKMQLKQQTRARVQRHFSIESIAAQYAALWNSST